MDKSRGNWAQIATPIQIGQRLTNWLFIINYHKELINPTAPPPLSDLACTSE